MTRGEPLREILGIGGSGYPILASVVRKRALYHLHKHLDAQLSKQRDNIRDYVWQHVWEQLETPMWSSLWTVAAHLHIRMRKEEL